MVSRPGWGCRWWWARCATALARGATPCGTPAPPGTCWRRPAWWGWPGRCAGAGPACRGCRRLGSRRRRPGRRRESLLGVLCGLAGMIPASTSASRSRIVLAQAGPSRDAPRWHAGIMLGVAVTGAWWLHWVPMACLAGGLVLAGLMQVPGLMWSLRYAQRSRVTWAQSWLVALVFAVMGGVGALVAGLVVATFVLLHDSAAKVLRHVRLDGELRSRRLRRAGSDTWLSPRMNQVAVFELQGV